MLRQKDTHYAMPLRLEDAMRGKPLEQIDLRKAIHQNVKLMLKSMLCCYRFDPTFGSVLNKYHAATPPQRRAERSWREEMRGKIQENIKDMLQRYETRVTIRDVYVELQEPSAVETSPMVKVKVSIVGQLSLGRKEQFHYPDSEIDEDAQEAFPLVIPVGTK